MEFTYEAKIKPYVRMTQKGKWSDPQAREYMRSKAALAHAIKAQMLERKPIPEKTPFTTLIIYQAPNAFQFDSDNLLKAVLDAAQGILFPDDRWGVDERVIKTRGPYRLYFEVQACPDYKVIFPNQAAAFDGTYAHRSE